MWCGPLIPFRMRCSTSYTSARKDAILESKNHSFRISAYISTYAVARIIVHVTLRIMNREPSS